MSNQPQRLTFTRGDTLKIEFTLDTPWTPAQFTAGVFLTVRREFPASTVLDDDDALAHVAVTFSGQVGTAEIADNVTAGWPSGTELRWDIEGRIATPRYVHTIKRGTLVLDPDITRGTWP